jgi:hypothetical protein
MRNDLPKRQHPTAGEFEHAVTAAMLNPLLETCVVSIADYTMFRV